MSLPVISVIIPIYNVEKEIHRCVESVINQTLEEVEIILVDDGSPDDCPIICDEFAKNDKRIKVIHKKNGGLSDARNVGILESLGKYILFVDPDDYIDIRACEKLYSSAVENIDIIVGDAVRIEGKKELVINHVELDPEIVLSGNDFLKMQLQRGKMNMFVWLNLYNREFLIKNDLFFKEGILHEDGQWTPRVFLKAERVKYIKFSFYNYVIRKNSITQFGDKSKNGIDILKTCYELEEIYKKIEDSELKKLLNDNLVFSFLFAIDFGDLYSERYKALYSKRFLIGKPLSCRNKARAYVFIINKRAYKYIYGLCKRILYWYK